MAAALPFVAYSTCSVVTVPPGEWPSLYASLQALKAHVQEYPGCQGFDVFVRAGDGEGVHVHCYTTWDTEAQLEAFLERGYTFERMLADLSDEIAQERSLVMEKLF
jgi:quinol monooxygenase YgiN